MNIPTLYDLRFLVLLDFLNMPTSYYQKTLSVKCIVVSSNRIFATAAQSGGMWGDQVAGAAETSKPCS